MTADPLHIYIESLPPPTGAWMRRALGTKQVTDAYLLGLAKAHSAPVLTFDTRLKALAGSQVKTEILSGYAKM